MVIGTFESEEAAAEWANRDRSRNREVTVLWTPAEYVVGMEPDDAGADDED